MKLYVAFLVVLMGLAGCGNTDSGAGKLSPTSIPTPERLFFRGAGDLGMFDPSVTTDPTSGRLWMSYSSVETSQYYPPSTYWAVSVRLAYSDDNGASWQDAGIIAAPKVERLLGPLTEGDPRGDIPANSEGIWQSETSSLVYDPSAPANEQWKLIWFQYLYVGGVPFYADYSWIALKMAATPLDLAGATPIKLFSGIGLQPDSAKTGAPVYAPTGGNPAIRLNIDLTQAQPGASLTDLNACVFAEPGLHATSDSLYLAIYCANAATNPITESLEYFRCASPCNITQASSWEYAGHLLTIADAQAATGEHHFQAPDLIQKGTATYLAVTPVAPTGPLRYDGCRVYEFEDINTTQLRRNNGVLAEMGRFDGESNTHAGACSMVADMEGGLLMGQFDPTTSPETFRVYRTQVQLP